MIIFFAAAFALFMSALTAYLAFTIIEIYNDAARTAAEYELDRESPIPRKGQK